MKRVALIKELAEQRLRMEGVDDMELRLRVKSLGTMRSLSLPEGTIVQVVEAVVQGMAKGQSLRTVLEQHERLRGTLHGGFQPEFRSILNTMHEMSPSQTVTHYVKYRLDVEARASGQGTISYFDLCRLLPPAFAEIARWHPGFTFDLLEGAALPADAVRDEATSPAPPAKLDQMMPLKIFIGLFALSAGIILLFAHQKARKAHTVAVAVAEVPRPQALPPEPLPQRPAVIYPPVRAIPAIPLQPPPAMAIAPSLSNGVALSQEEAMSLRMACINAQMQGPAAYNRCVQGHLGQLRYAQRPQGYYSLSSEEQISLRMACIDAIMQGPAMYNQCAQRHLSAMGRY